MLEKKIVELKKQLIEEAGLGESMVGKSTKGLISKEKKLLSEVINNDEPIMNQSEIKIDELCTSLIALYQPEAENLRTILMILKMNNDLERIGDLAVNIAHSALYLIERPLIKPLIDIPRMSDEAINMLKDAINSFVNGDVALARSVCERDVIVDEVREQILRELITYMVSDPNTIKRSLELIKITHSLERIGDLSTNISEDTIFMIEGKIIKHHNEEN